MKLLSIRKILYQIALSIVICTSSSLLATNASDVQQSPTETNVAARLAISRDIAEAREKLAEYRMSQSFFGTISDVAAVTTIGTALGCLAGLAHMLLSENLMGDMLTVLQGSRTAYQDEFIAKSLRVALLGLQGAMSGFVLGVASQSGSLPQMSKGHMTLVLALQNVIAAALALATDHIGINALESAIRQTMQQDGDLVGNIAGRVIGRQGLFAYAIAHDRMDERAKRDFATALPSLATAASQAIALLLVIPEAMIIRSNRKNNGQKQQQLDCSLKELQRMLNEIENLN